MNHLAARQDRDTGRWHYTARDQHGRVQAVGACDQDGGHPVEAEACACYRDWLLANRLQLDCSMGEGQLRACALPGCGEPTERMAECDGWCAPLCEDHMDDATVRGLFPSVGTRLGAS